MMSYANDSHLNRKKRALYLLMSVVALVVGIWILVHAPRNGELDVTNALEWGGGALLVGIGLYRAYKAFAT